MDINCNDRLIVSIFEEIVMTRVELVFFSDLLLLSILVGSS